MSPSLGREASPTTPLRSASGRAEGRVLTRGTAPPAVLGGGSVASKKLFSVGRPVVWVGVAVLCAALAVGAWFLKSTGVENGVKAAHRVR